MILDNIPTKMEQLIYMTAHSHNLSYLNLYVADNAQASSGDEND